jgi:hypothetical protein
MWIWLFWPKEKCIRWIIISHWIWALHLWICDLFIFILKINLAISKLLIISCCNRALSPLYKRDWLFKTNANQASNMNKYVNVKDKLWNNNQSVLCDGRKINVVNYIPTHDADISTIYHLYCELCLYSLYRDSLLKEDNCYFNVGNNIYVTAWALCLDFLIISYITRNDYLVEYKYSKYRNY